MKKLLLILVLLLSVSPIFSQVEVSSRLQQALNKANLNDYIKVLVLLRSQVDLVSLDQQLYNQKATLQQRAYQVITALKQNAENTQGELKTYLDMKSESTEVFTYQAFWISNLFMVEAKPVVLNEIMNRADISIMDLDELLDYDRPVDKSPATLESLAGSEPGPSGYKRT